MGLFKKKTIIDTNTKLPYNEALNTAKSIFKNNIESSNFDKELEDLMVKWICNYEDLRAALLVGIYEDQVNEEEHYCAVDIRFKIHTQYSVAQDHYIYIARILQRFESLDEVVNLNADRANLVQECKDLINSYGKERSLRFIPTSDKFSTYPNEQYIQMYEIKIPETK